MDVQCKTKITRELLEVLMELPAFRYMKPPVDTIPQLYDRYPTGNERNSYAFVLEEEDFFYYIPGTISEAPRWEIMSSSHLKRVLEDAIRSANDAAVSAESSTGAAIIAAAALEQINAYVVEIGSFQQLISEMDSRIDANVLSVSELTERISRIEGRGGSIPAASFGTGDVELDSTQSLLTEYASASIWNKGQTGGTFAWNTSDPASSTYVIGGVTHYASEIFNSTWTRNTDNGHRIVLTNTQDTTPKVFEWADVGVDTVNIATSEYAGIVKSNPAGGEFIVDPATGDVSIAEYATTPSAIAGTTSLIAVNTKKTIKLWMLDIWSRINGILTKINSVKTIGGQSIWGTGDISVGGQPSSSVPLMDGLASIGSSTQYSRADHIHPKDTTKVDKVNTSNILYGTDSAGNTRGNAYSTMPLPNNIVKRENTAGFIEVGSSVPTSGDWAIGSRQVANMILGKDATLVPTANDGNSTGTVGSSSRLAREDHKHPQQMRTINGYSIYGVGDINIGGSTDAPWKYEPGQFTQIETCQNGNTLFVSGSVSSTSVELPYFFIRMPLGKTIRGGGDIKIIGVIPGATLDDAPTLVYGSIAVASDGRIEVSLREPLPPSRRMNLDFFIALEDEAISLDPTQISVPRSGGTYNISVYSSSSEWAFSAKTILGNDVTDTFTKNGQSLTATFSERTFNQVAMTLVVSLGSSTAECGFSFP